MLKNKQTTKHFPSSLLCLKRKAQSTLYLAFFTEVFPYWIIYIYNPTNPTTLILVQPETSQVPDDQNGLCVCSHHMTSTVGTWKQYILTDNPSLY